MKYLGMDVHSKATVWCLLDGDGESVARGSVETNASALGHLASELSCEEEILAGQEVGTMAYLVHDPAQRDQERGGNRDSAGDAANTRSAV